jgi:hypothetical protein
MRVFPILMGCIIGVSMKLSNLWFDNFEAHLTGNTCYLNSALQLLYRCNSVFHTTPLDKLKGRLGKMIVSFFKKVNYWNMWIYLNPLIIIITRTANIRKASIFDQGTTQGWMGCTQAKRCWCMWFYFSNFSTFSSFMDKFSN